MSVEYSGEEKVKLIFSKDDHEIAEKCLALVLIRSLYEKKKIAEEIMKKTEQIFEK